ncbi:MAG TPA: hypothetical protein VLK82_16560 [Candidatus Tectomicrobia bacterium]|nr:hypothetical protein [Candidatus Tectomicrobia bacterium]
MAQQTEQRAVINGRNYVGFVVPGQFITIYRADEESKPINDGLEGVWTFRSETLKLGANPTLNEGDIRHYFVNRLGEAETDQAAPSRANRVSTTLKALFRDFTIPPMSIISLILAALMLIAGVLMLIDAPGLGPLMGGMVFGSAILLLLFAIFGPFLW